MKLFERGGKINFVDDNNVFVGFDGDQECCEDFGWCLTREFPVDGFQENREEINPDGFQFDVTFFKEVILSDKDFDPEINNHYSRETAVFRLTRGSEEIFLTLWNYHNGRYDHGFEMKAGDDCLREGAL